MPVDCASDAPPSDGGEERDRDPIMKRMPKPKREVRLIVAADEPPLFFSSVDAAEQYLEAIDVEDGVYPAAYGRRASLI